MTTTTEIFSIRTGTEPPSGEATANVDGNCHKNQPVGISKGGVNREIVVKIWALIQFFESFFFSLFRKQTAEYRCIQFTLGWNKRQSIALLQANQKAHGTSGGSPLTYQGEETTPPPPNTEEATESTRWGEEGGQCDRKKCQSLEHSG